MHVKRVFRRITRRLAIGEYESLEIAAEVEAELEPGDDRDQVQRIVDGMAREDVVYSAVKELEAVQHRRQLWADDAWKHRAVSTALLAAQLRAVTTTMRGVGADLSVSEPTEPEPTETPEPTRPTLADLKAEKAALTRELRAASAAGDSAAKKRVLDALKRVKASISEIQG